MNPGTAPTFTLRLREVTSVDRGDQSIVTRWVLYSDDPDWSYATLPAEVSSDGARRWATETVAENSTYIVTAWAHDEAADTWTAELKRIRHDFRLIWAGLPPRVMHAKNQDDADDVERCILQGENFIRLLDCNDRSVMIGLSQIQTITYEPTEVEL